MDEGTNEWTNEWTNGPNGTVNPPQVGRISHERVDDPTDSAPTTPTMMAARKGHTIHSFRAIRSDSRVELKLEARYDNAHTHEVVCDGLCNQTDSGGEKLPEIVDELTRRLIKARARVRVCVCVCVDGHSPPPTPPPLTIGWASW